MLLGAHVSVAGGLVRAFERGRELGCEAIQIFACPPRSWAVPPLGDDVVAAFRAEAAKAGWPVLSHVAYLVNLASPSLVTRERSLERLAIEWSTAARLGLDGMVLHPGTHPDLEIGRELIARGLGQAWRAADRPSTPVLLETTAGQGHSIGHTFDQLAWLLDHLDPAVPAAVCLDTCHVAQAGYDPRGRAGHRELMRALDRSVSLERVAALHLNDCKRAPGTRVDRHEHIGQGTLGDDVFRRLLTEPRLADRPALLETPGRFAENLAHLRALYP